MSLPDRDNPYGFDSYLEWRDGVDYYADDPFLQRVLRHFAGDQWEAVDAAARELSSRASRRWRDLSESIARLEKRPFLVHFDGHNRRVDRLVRPAELEQLEGEVFSEGLFARATPSWVRLAKMFLIYQNGEAGIACPVTCTEGMVELLDRFADTPETKRILRHVKEGVDGEFAIGAQYLTEIQGGSDVPSNLVEAVKETVTAATETSYRLYGKKYFCSVAHADYALVTAKPSGSEAIGIFVVPMWLPGNKQREVRNGCTIDKLKWKMGTCELPTAEMTFDGAIGYPVGLLDRGLANVVGIVLTYSRLTVGLSAASSMTRVAREARRYADFREAFGIPIARFPMLAGQLDRLERDAQRTTAAAFKIYRELLSPDGGLEGGLRDDVPRAVRRKRFDIRELIMLQKITTTWDATDAIRSAMSVLGGHGVIEDFSAIPRLFRDAAINELWEGPRNTLLTQIFRDCQRVREWYTPQEFVGSLLRGADRSVVTALAEEAYALLGHPSLLTDDERTREVCAHWDDYCHRLFHAYQDLALAAVNGSATSASEAD